jgi:hypothetical protein
MLLSGFAMERWPDSQSFCTWQSLFRGASQKNECTPRKCNSEFLAVSMEPQETVRKSDAMRNWAEARKKLESHSMESQFFCQGISAKMQISDFLQRLSQKTTCKKTCHMAYTIEEARKN